MGTMTGLAGAALLAFSDMDEVKVFFTVAESGNESFLFEDHFGAMAIETEGRGAEIEIATKADVKRTPQQRTKIGAMGIVTLVAFTALDRTVPVSAL